MKYKLTVKEQLHCSHKIVGHFDECHSLHGHSYNVVAVMESNCLDSMNMVADAKKIKTTLRQFDHVDLNMALETDHPSVELFAKIILNALAPFNCVKVTVAETRDIEVEVTK